MNRLRRRLAKCEETVRDAWTQVEQKIAEYFPAVDTRFREFTRHDESHIRALENILDWLVPNDVWEKLTDSEILCLLTGLWAHDAGMGASDEEIRDLCDTGGLEKPDGSTAAMWFLRDHHPEISRRLVNRIYSELSDETLSALGTVAGDIARSHGYADLENLPSRLPFGHSGAYVRPAYLGILLRLADILHCTSDRAPMSLFKARAIKDPISVDHWKQHQATLGVGPDAEGGTVLINITANDVTSFSWATRYADWIQEELDYSAAVIAKQNLAATGLNVRALRVRRVATVPFVDKVIRIEVDTPAAVNMLVGRQLYDDPSVAVRELIQNAIDAISLRKELENLENPSISVILSTSDNTLTVSDNGIGMKLRDLQSRLLRSCTSGFRGLSDSSAILARHGIGFLTTLAVSDKIRVESRFYNAAASDGYVATICGASTPVDVRKTSKDEVGTVVTLQLNQEIGIDDLKKWFPGSHRADWIDMRVDNSIIEQDKPMNGAAIEPLRFESKTFEKGENGIRVVLRSSALKGIAEAWPCGLSFQNVTNLNAKIVDVPDVSKRMYVGDIPVVTKDGRRPNYTVTKSPEPSFEKMHGPFDLYIENPRLIELNLARNALTETSLNGDTLNRAGRLTCQLLIEWFNELVDQGENPARLASRFVSEFWLTRLSKALSCLTYPYPAYNTDCIAELADLFNQLTLYGLSNTGESIELSVGKLIKIAGYTILVHAVVVKQIEAAGQLTQFLSGIREIFPDFTIITECENINDRRYTVFDVLFTLAISAALLDITSLGVPVSPVFVFNLGGSSDFQPGTMRSIEIYGTDKLFCGMQPRSIATQRITGGNNPHLMINLHADPDVVNAAAGKMLHTAANAIPVPIPLRRETISQFLQRQGVQREYTKGDYIHSSIIQHYPTVSFR